MMQMPAFLKDYTLFPIESHRLTRKWCAEMRKQEPVYFDEESQSWYVFRYADVLRIRRDYTTFSSEKMVKNQDGETRSTSIITMDPPRHRQMRSLITQAFSARTISQMGPQIEVLVDDLLAQVRPTGKIDWVADMTNPLPVMVIMKMLGLPIEEWRNFKVWTDEIINTGPDMAQASGQLAMVFLQAIEEHYRKPQKDVLGLLIDAEVDGEKLSSEDLLGFCFTLLIAGNITTTNTLGNGMLCLDQNPAAVALLKERPELIAGAVEEILRYMPPGRVGANDLIAGRVTTTEVQLGDKLLRKGELVQTPELAANFDPEQFSDPDRFNVERSPNPHQTFGHGIHFCIGAPLARLEMQIALRKTLEQLPDLTRVKDEPIEQIRSTIMFGPNRLPMTFQVS